MMEHYLVTVTDPADPQRGVHRYSKRFSFETVESAETCITEAERWGFIVTASKSDDKIGAPA